MKAINKRLVASFVMSIFLHAFVILLFFLFQKQTPFPTPKKTIDLKKKDENIVLLSLANYQVSEKQNEPSTEAQEAITEHHQLTKTEETTPTEIRKEQLEPIVKDEIIAQKEEQPKPEKISSPHQEKESAQKESPLIEKPKTIISPEEIITIARTILCKNKTSLTKTVTKTDFFKHAHAVAQQRSIQRTNEDLAARISGLGNLKLYSYEEKLRSTLLTAFNSLKHRIDRTVRPEQQHLPSPQPHAAINLIINKDGSIDTLNLITSSGDQTFDGLIIDSIKYAAPFPPIPAHLGIDKFQLGAMQLYVRY